MKAVNTAINFSKEETGAVTVDWVVLTAAVVGLGLLIGNTMGSTISATATSIGTEITASTPD